MKLLLCIICAAATATTAADDGAVAADADGAAGRRGRDLDFGIYVPPSTKSPTGSPTESPTPATFVSVVLAVSGLSNPPTADEELALRTAIASLLTGVDLSDVTLDIASAADRRRRLQENLDLVSVEVKCVENCATTLDALEAPTLPTDLADALASAGTLPDFVVGCVGEPALSEEALPPVGCEVGPPTNEPTEPTLGPIADPTSTAAPSTVAPSTAAPSTMQPSTLFNNPTMQPTTDDPRWECLQGPDPSCDCCSECTVKDATHVGLDTSNDVDLQPYRSDVVCVCLDIRAYPLEFDYGKNIYLSDGDDCVLISAIDVGRNKNINIWGGYGTDMFTVGEGEYRKTGEGLLGLYGDEGEDYMYAIGSSMRLYGGDQQDYLVAIGSKNYINGEAGDDIVGAAHLSFMGEDGNYVYGGSGDDHVTLLSGIDDYDPPAPNAGIAYGGSGNDLLRVKGTTGTYFNGGADYDKCYLNSDRSDDGRVSGEFECEGDVPI